MRYSVAFVAMFLSSACVAQDAPDWQTSEGALLRDPVQLTFAEQFLKAGESYFSPDNKRIIFQGELPTDDEATAGMYSMFIADVVRNDRGRVTGIDNVRRLSPARSANTCGWFHPTDANRVLFASTIVAPTESSPPGYQRGERRYRWMFPPEMDIVSARLDRMDASSASLEPLVGDPEAYMAEGTWSPDGRHLLFCSLQSNEGDLYVRDLEKGVTNRIVSARGYDGGPFFSPDGERICYRSDRRGNHELQLFVADLAREPSGTIVGIEREFQLTDNEHVNWCPFWHPDGRHLVYATSEVGHRNYEIFVIDADPGDRPGSDGSIKYGTRKRRVTHAPGADVLPAFSSDGRTMIWTSKRGPEGTSQLWVADFVMDLDARPAPKRSPH